MKKFITKAQTNIYWLQQYIYKLGAIEQDYGEKIQLASNTLHAAVRTMGYIVSFQMVLVIQVN